MTVAALDVREIPLAKLVRAEWNANRVPDETLAKVRRSVEQFGVVENLVVRPHPSERGKFEVLSGNHRLALYAELGLPSAPCHVLKLDDGRARVLAQVLNRTRGEDDPDAYRALMTTVLAQVERDEVLALLPETERSLRQLEEEQRRQVAFEAGEGGGDDVPEPPKVAKSKPGEVYELGAHRLMCGDSTDREQVATLLNGERASVMVTDPPYGVIFGSAKKNAIQGDLSQALIPVSFAVAVDHALDDDARVYLFGGSGNWSMYAKLFDYHLQQEPHPIVWVKESFVMRPNGYHSQFEMVYFGWKGKGGGPSYWFGDRKTSDVWGVARDRDGLHPTQKPVEACAIPIRNSAPNGGLVYEPFGGSGSTLIAAESLGRRCYAMEIDPRYCDVIRQRYADHVGRPEFAP